jgi:predicted nucleotidyltransferase component of viral defense system
MISEKCFGQEWISAKAMELRYPDKNVIERVVRAFSLLDMLARSGCPFVFKGGTSLMLLLQETGSRLSTDIDIICPPETNIETYLQEYAASGFVRYELVERRQRGSGRRI